MVDLAAPLDLRVPFGSCGSRRAEPVEGRLPLGVLRLGRKLLKEHDLKCPVFGILYGLVANAAVTLLPSDGGIKVLGMNPDVGPGSALTEVLAIKGSAPKFDPLSALRTLNLRFAGMGMSCPGEAVEECPALLSGNLLKRPEILRNVPPGTLVVGDARNQDVCGDSEIVVVGWSLWLVGILCHHITLPSIYRTAATYVEAATKSQ
jgi:hypothetical protein